MTDAVLTDPDELTAWVARETGLMLEPWQADHLALLLEGTRPAEHLTPRRDAELARCWVKGYRCAVTAGRPEHEAVEYADRYSTTDWQALGVAANGLADALTQVLRPALATLATLLPAWADEQARARRQHHHHRKHAGRPRPRTRPGRRRRR